MNAETTINKLKEIDPSNSSFTTELREIDHLRRYIVESEAAYAAKDFRKVLLLNTIFLFSRLIFQYII